MNRFGYIKGRRYLPNALLSSQWRHKAENVVYTISKIERHNNWPDAYYLKPSPPGEEWYESLAVLLRDYEPV